MPRFALGRGLAAALLVGLLLAPAAAAQIETEVSTVTGTERIESADMRALHVEQYAGSHAAFRAAYVNDPDDGIAWTLSVYGFTETPTPMSEANDLRVTADGRAFTPTQLTSKTRRVDGTVLEIKRAVFPRSAFEAIATAEAVRLTIGGAQFSAIHARRSDLRRILEQVPENPTPRTASTDSSGGR